MTPAQLTVLSIVPDREPWTPWEPAYRVTGAKAPHRVTLDPPACDCPDFRYKGQYRTPPRCKHLVAVQAWKAAEPQAGLLDGLTEKETLDIVDPSHSNHSARPSEIPIDPEDRAVAIAALEKWGELRRTKPKPNGYYGLWRAACAAMNGIECEKAYPSQAAEYFAIARAYVAHIGRKGRVA